MAKILIAEDERDIRELIEFTLTAYAGHQVFKAANGVGSRGTGSAGHARPDYDGCADADDDGLRGVHGAQTDRSSVKDIPVVFLSAKGQEVGDRHGDGRRAHMITS